MIFDYKISSYSCQKDGCQNIQDVPHRCYGNNESLEIHEINTQWVCHCCWDKNLEDAVLSAGY